MSIICRNCDRTLASDHSSLVCPQCKDQKPELADLFSLNDANTSSRVEGQNRSAPESNQRQKSALNSDFSSTRQYSVEELFSVNSDISLKAIGAEVETETLSDIEHEILGQSHNFRRQQTPAPSRPAQAKTLSYDEMIRLSQNKLQAIAPPSPDPLPHANQLTTIDEDDDTSKFSYSDVFSLIAHEKSARSDHALTPSKTSGPENSPDTATSAAFDGHAHRINPASPEAVPKRTVPGGDGPSSDAAASKMMMEPSEITNLAPGNALAPENTSPAPGNAPAFENTSPAPGNAPALENTSPAPDLAPTPEITNLVTDLAPIPEITNFAHQRTQSTAHSGPSTAGLKTPQATPLASHVPSSSSTQNHDAEGAAPQAKRTRTKNSFPLSAIIAIVCLVLIIILLMAYIIATPS